MSSLRRIHYYDGSLNKVLINFQKASVYSTKIIFDTPCCMLKVNNLPLHVPYRLMNAERFM